MPSQPQYFGLFLGTFRSAAQASPERGAEQLEGCLGKIVGCNPGISERDALSHVKNALKEYPRDAGTAEHPNENAAIGLVERRITLNPGAYRPG